MLDNLRKKSMTKTYNDPRYQIHFEHGLAKYGSCVEIDVCNQKLSKELQVVPFRKVIDTISSDTSPWLRFNMIACPKGSFIMGHKDQGDDNIPRTETIDRSFLLGETEITQELYKKVMGTNPSAFKNPQNPMEQVSWEEAIQFCNELSRLQGLDECYTKNSKSLVWNCDFKKNGYRLPEEKEWEYAAKAGTQNRWAGTDDFENVGDYAWFGEDANSPTPTHQVKTKKPNEWGFYDMSGNVFEWCWDQYHSTKSRSKDFRVVRGGCWNDSVSWLRSDYRNNKTLSTRSKALGFRIARSLVN